MSPTEAIDDAMAAIVSVSPPKPTESRMTYSKVCPSKNAANA